MKQINILLTKEEVRVIHQSLNEVCSGIDFEDSEFETRIGAAKNFAKAIMSKLEVVYKSIAIKADDFS